MIRWVFAAYREAFAGLPREVWLVAAVTLIYRSGTMVMPFLPIYLTSEQGLSVPLAGAYLALWGVGAVIGAMIGGRVAELLGNTRTMSIALVLAGVGFFAMGAMRDPWSIAVVVFLTSIVAESYRTPSSAAIAAAAGPETRARAFALRRLAINLGMAVGPAVGGILATIDYAWLFLADGATCLIAGVYAWSLKLRAEADDEAGTSDQLRAPYSLWSNGTLLAVVACAACTSLAFGQLFAAYPLTLKQGFGHPEPVIGAAFALNTLLIVAFEMVLQHRLARCRPLLVMTGGCLMLALGYLLVQADPHLTAVFIAMSVLTLGEMLLYPVIESYVIGLVPKRAMSRAIGMLNATFAATLVVSPAIGTLLYEVWGYRFLWLSCAALTICAAAGFLAIETRSSLGERLQTTP